MHRTPSVHSEDADRSSPAASEPDHQLLESEIRLILETHASDEKEDTYGTLLSIQTMYEIAGIPFDLNFWRNAVNELRTQPDGRRHSSVDQIMREWQFLRKIG